MKRVATAVILIPIVLLIVFRAPLWLFAAVVGAIALITTREYLGLVEHCGIKPARALTYVFTALLFVSVVVGFVAESELRKLSSQVLLRGISPAEHPYLSVAIGASSLGTYTLLLAGVVLLTVLMNEENLRNALPAAACSSFALIYVSVPFAFLLNIRYRAGGAFFVLYLLIVVWTGDILAFFTGRSLGKHKLAPRISPNKSWEGAFASFVGATAIGTLLLHGGDAVVGFLLNSHVLPPQQGSILSVGPYPAPKPLWVYVLLSGVMNIAAQIGDLAESMIKRGAGVKDSGALLPGHGGMLDRIDALLFAAPVLWYYALVLTTVHIP